MNWFKLLLLAVVCMLSSRAEEVILPATRDVWLSSYPSERRCNLGAAEKLKLKIYQEFALVDFDVSALGDRRVRRAWLHVKAAGGHKFGLNGNTDLTWLVLSTVSHEWVEGASASYAEDHEGHGATFLESSFERESWGWPGATVCDVTLGNGNTIRSHGRLEPIEDGWLRMPVDPRLVSALQAGATHGLMVQDGATYVLVNCFIASRESGQGPFLRVETGPAEPAAPAPVDSLRVVPAADAATATHGALRVMFTMPPEVFSYDIRVDGKPVDRWQIPFAGTPELLQTVTLRDLPPKRRVSLEIRPVSRTGIAGEWQSLSGQTSDSLCVPRRQLPQQPSLAPADPPSLGENATVWAAPPVAKVDPVSAKVRHESATDDFRRRNPMWDAASRTVTVHTARGGIASFQLLLEGRIRDGRIAFSSLAGTGSISGDGFHIWRNWYVGREAELALPLAGNVQCPWPDNGITGQRLQGLTVALPIAPDQLPGQYRGTISVSDGADNAELVLVLHVHDVVIPQRIFFNPELNCYGGPGRAGSEKFRDSFRVAHFHRCTINRVPYGQRGNTHADWAPDVDAKGAVVDWRRFDENLGGLLDGSWFRGNPRAGVPVPKLYLPLSPSFPLDFRKHYHPGPGVPVNPADPEDLLRHDALAIPPEEALSSEYQAAFKRCASDFAEHLTEKGWTETVFEFYLNNKPKFGYTPWTLDEPVKYRDWAALNVFGTWFKEAIADPAVYTPGWHRALFEEGLAGMGRSRATLLYRGDVSRPQWQGNVSDGIINLMICNNGIFDYRRLVQAQKERMPATLYCYGSCNAVQRANWETVAWCVKAYINGADGVIPWQSLAGSGALKEADTNGLIVDAGPYGHAVASLRVHALREGAEMCELLRLIQLRKGWTREHVGMLVSQYIDLGSAFQQRSTDEAAAVIFDQLDSMSFVTMKTSLLQWLGEAPSLPGAPNEETP